MIEFEQRIDNDNNNISKLQLAEDNNMDLEPLEISLHVLVGILTLQTMRIQFVSTPITILDNS